MKESVAAASNKIRFNFDVWRYLEKANVLKKNVNYYVNDKLSQRSFCLPAHIFVTEGFGL